MLKIRYAIALSAVALAGCVQSSDPAAIRQAEATRKMTDQADRLTGMPAITNFAERKLLRDVYERRDRAGPTYAYLQGMDGRLSCLGRAMGYGIPYAAQFTAPKALQWVSATDNDGQSSQHSTELMDQPEPNGLYMPDSAAATWLQILNPKTGKVDVVYVEPNLTVSPFRLSGPIVAHDCED